jgi:hypothetical protein
VEPDARAVEVWRFEGSARCERVTGSLPVRIGGVALGDVDLPAVFRAAEGPGEPD